MEVYQSLDKPVTIEEIEQAILKANSDKAPGVDDLNACFYKICWEIIREDVTNAILKFFQSGQFLRQINITFITLLPKTSNPTSFSNFVKCFIDLSQNYSKHTKENPPRYY